MINFGLIGCGRISHKHVEAIIDNQPQAELIWLCDLIPERAIERQKEYRAAVNKSPNITRDYFDIINDESVDAVIIATESGYHGRLALDALHHGKHVLIEKPMALTLKEIDQINELAEQKNLKVCVSHQNRFNPAIQKLRRAVEDDRFGRIINVTARILWNRAQSYYDQAPWRGTKLLDGGTLMNQCIHNIDLLQWMAGSPMKSVKCERGTYLRDIEMEDFGALLVRFENDTIGVIEGSACVYPKNLEETLSIFGEKGTVVIGGLAVNEIKTWLFADKRPYDDEVVDTDVSNVYGYGHTPLYSDFIDAILHNRKPYIDGHDGRNGVEIILEAYKNPLIPQKTS